MITCYGAVAWNGSHPYTFPVGEQQQALNALTLGCELTRKNGGRNERYVMHKFPSIPSKLGWIIPLLLLLMGLSMPGLLTLCCPEWAHWLRNWINEEPAQMQQRVRIVLWALAVVPATIFLGFLGIWIWIRMRRSRERGFPGHR